MTQFYPPPMLSGKFHSFIYLFLYPFPYLPDRAVSSPLVRLWMMVVRGEWWDTAQCRELGSWRRRESRCCWVTGGCWYVRNHNKLVSHLSCLVEIILKLHHK